MLPIPQRRTKTTYEGQESPCINEINALRNTGGSELKMVVLEATKKHTLVTIIPHPQAIISNALDYILLIVDSSDPNLS